jgi:hypothetical protein
MNSFVIMYPPFGAMTFSIMTHGKRTLCGQNDTQQSKTTQNNTKQDDIQDRHSAEQH